MRRIAFVTTGLGIGGAEMMLLKILPRIDSRRFEPTVISLTGLGQLGPKMKSLGVTVYDPGMRTAADVPAGALRIGNYLREARPDVIQGWMVHGNFAATLGGLMTGKPVYWGVRHSAPLDPKVERRSTVLLERLLVLFSGIPKHIVYNSGSGKAQHEALGYASRRGTVIPNGFDLDRFKPDGAVRAATRRELQIEDDSFVIGLVARFHPMKDHATFLEAVRLLRPSLGPFKVVLAGDGCSPGNSELRKMIADRGLTDDVLPLGPRSDMERLTAALDVATNSSRGAEGFANTIGEAMATGIPCVATRIGDAELVVGDAGEVVPPRDPRAFAEGLRRMIALGPQGREELGMKARKRIAEKFSIDAVARQYEALYDGEAPGE